MADDKRGSGDSSVVSAPDSWSKGRGFESLQEHFSVSHHFPLYILTQIWKTTKLEMHIDTKLRENGGSIDLNFILFNQVLWQMTRGGVGIAQWLVHQTHDQKVVGSNPCRSSGRIFFSGVNFLCWLLFWYPFYPCVTAVACKRSWSVCQKCRWQVTDKHACTLHTWLCMKWHGTWLYGVHRMRRNGSRAPAMPAL